MSETLLNEIRATKPEASSALRERVRALSVEAPAREPFLDRVRFNWGWRRLVLAVPATVVVALVAAGVIGLTRDGVTGGGDQSASSGAAGFDSRNALTVPDAALESEAAAPSATKVAGDAAGGSAGIVPPSTGQLQRYEAELRLRVDDVEALSTATKRAQQIALRHDGSVASLQYDAPAAGIGAAQITLRVPTARVQSAMAQLAALGTIVGQRYGIDDLQQQADSLQTQIEQTQRQVAQLRARLASTTLSDETRAVLEGRLTNARQKLTSLRQARSATVTEARTATIYLSLTTEEIEPAAVGSGSRLDDVKDVLAWEGIAILFFLVVAGPFLVVGLLVWLTLRTLRRRQEARLLEQN